MIPALRCRCRDSKLVSILYGSPWGYHWASPPLLARLYSFNSIDSDAATDRRRPQQPARGERFTSRAQDNSFPGDRDQPAGVNNNDSHDIDYYNYNDPYGVGKRTTYNTVRQNPPDPIPNRPLRGEKQPIHQPEHLSRRNHGQGGDKRYGKSTAAVSPSNLKNKPVGGLGVAVNRTSGQSPSTSSDIFLFKEEEEEEDTKKQHSEYSGPQHSPIGGENQQQQGLDFLEKFRLGFDKRDKHLSETAASRHDEEMKAVAESPPPAQDVEEIFKKMKETGLIPNAVAMLDGLCKDGLVQEAMKLFAMMREKATIPEVVIYTAVVEGFCKAHKLDDAKRIFRKMQNNGISPNAFSYTVLIQGLYKCRRLDDALNFCVEMLEAGHLPNLATFVGLVDGFCQERSVEEARSAIGTLMQKGFYFDEKTVREYLDKKGPFTPLVWEAIFKKSSQISV